MTNIHGKLILITGAARRVGRAIALGVAQAGARVVIHYWRSHEEAIETHAIINESGGEAHLIQANLNDPTQATLLMQRAAEIGQIDALVNNAAIFESLTWETSDLDTWQRHLNINLLSPFFLSQAYARQANSSTKGRIINILDWRALRPGVDHLPYTISKAALAALTKSMAAALAPNFTVNGLALGAILLPNDGSDSSDILRNVPARRWADIDEVIKLTIFLLDGPEYITGEIIHIDGGRHLI